MSMECYIMHRTGKFKPRRSTSNQCKIAGHNEYLYKLSIVFPNSVKLDANRFIIDHQKLDDMIQKLRLYGSCEQMHKKICDNLQRLLKLAKIDCIGFKCSIKPQSENVAYMEYVFVKEDKNSAMIFSQNH